MSEAGAVYIGTSGWHYDHWQGPFYPDDLPPPQRLAYYAQRLPTAEINNTFYQLPDAETLAGWQETTPDTFTFAVKASRYITHQKNLKDPQEPVTNFLQRVERLGEKLGPILFQLPPHWHVNHERLANFLQVLPARVRAVFEFRHESWFDDRVYELLREHGAAFCIYELAGDHSPRIVTADFVYVRLHGPGDAAYEGRYDPQTLSGWAGALSAWRRSGKTVYCYFDNDQAGYAAQNAVQLNEMLS